jgi:hypothetical protein
MSIYRMGDAVTPYKSNKFVQDKASKSSVKKPRMDDPADTGSGKAATSVNPKYSDTPSLYSKQLIKTPVKGADLRLIEASYAKASWAKHSAAINSLKKFEYQRGSFGEWPLSIEFLSEYVSWALSEKGLQPSTVKTYLSSIKIVHQLNNLSYNGDHFTLNSLLTGAENLSIYDLMKKSTRKAMSLPLLRIIGHQIAKSNWSADSKLTVWTACVLAFFGSFRFGEILSNSCNSFCANETLLWNDIKFRKDNSILIHVKIDKCLNKNGSYVDIFEFKYKNCCPVVCLNALKSKKFSLNKPVFQFENGKNLCTAVLNKTLFQLLYPVLGNSASEITSHSFRAGIPSAMASFPDLTSKYDIQCWGRWSSDSYLKYTRLKAQQKKCIFEKIVNSLVQ